MFDILKQDLRRYRTENGFAWYEPSILAIVCYRFGQFSKRCPWGVRHLLTICHVPVSFFVTLMTGIHLPRGAKIGPGLRIFHFGCIILNPLTVIGKNCTLRHEVTIGNRRDLDDVPVIGDDVEFGAGAKVLGKIVIGSHAKIGANAVVLTDVPPYCVAVGIPAKIIEHTDHESCHRS